MANSRRDLQMSRSKSRWALGAICACLMIALMVRFALASTEAKIDASGQWKYVVEDGGATITGYVAEPSGDLVIPSELDGCAVTGIGDSAFRWCEDLTSVTIPDSVASIGNGAFSYCRGLTRVTIPQSVTSMGSNPFAGCPLVLIDVSVDNLVYQMTAGILFDKQRKILVSYFGAWRGVYTIPEGVLHIGDNAFEDCHGLTGVVIPDGVTSIGNYAFVGCDNLTSVTIPDSVTSIGSQAFSMSFELTNVSIPANVTSIGTNPFAGCALTFIDISSDNPAYVSREGVLFDKQGERLISYPTAREGAYAIPEGTLFIADSAFEFCRGLTSVTIPETVTNIGDDAFRKCWGLADVIIPDSVTRIGNWAFSESELGSVIITEGVVSIGDYAFGFCEFANVTIPASVTSIGSNPFDGSPLMYIDVSSGNPTYASIDGVLFDKQRKMLVTYPSAKEGPYSIPEGTLLIGDDAFSGCEGLSSVTIPNSVTSIGDYAFYGCYGLINVDVPNGVTHIGDYAFALCSDLMSTTIPASVTSIGDFAFVNCPNVILHVTKGSAAEQHAKDNNIPFVYIE